MRYQFRQVKDARRGDLGSRSVASAVLCCQSNYYETSTIRSGGKLSDHEQRPDSAIRRPIVGTVWRVEKESWGDAVLIGLVGGVISAAATGALGYLLFGWVGLHAGAAGSLVAGWLLCLHSAFLPVSSDNGSI
jgi:hypothetical protein